MLNMEPTPPPVPNVSADAIVDHGQQRKRDIIARIKELEAELAALDVNIL